MTLSKLSVLPKQPKRLKLHLLKTSLSIQSRLSNMDRKEWTPVVNSSQFSAINKLPK